MLKTCGRGRKALAGSAALFAAAALLAMALAGCGGEKLPSMPELQAQAEQAAVAFLDACGNLDTAAVLSMMSSAYREANGLGDTLSPEALREAASTFYSYSFDPTEDIVIEQERALVTADIDYGTFGTREEILVLVMEGGGYLVDGFTAMNWSKPPATEPPEDDGAGLKEGAEKSLRSFVEACIKGDTAYVFKNLSDGYKSKKNLEKAWTASEFAGIFGEARSYEFEPEEMELMGDDRAEVDVSIDFGSRGNLERETTRAALVWENGAWKVDVFPFFLF